MRYVETTVNDINVIVEAFDPNLSGFADTDSEENTTKLEKMFDTATGLIDGIADKISAKMKEHDQDMLNELKVGFSIGATTEADVFVIKGKGELAIDVEMTFKRKNN